MSGTGVNENVNGNASTATYTPNSLNQYSETTNGGQHEISGYDGVSYNYLADTHLASVSSGSGGIYQMGYDALGRCVKRTTNGQSMYYAYDGIRSILAFTPTSNGAVVSATTLYGLGVDEIIARDNNGLAEFFHQDHLGNTSAITGITGEVIEQYRYDAFGTPEFRGPPSTTDPRGALLTSTQINNQLLFTGREWIASFGFYDYRARAYHPGLGRFMSEDPMGFAAGDNNLFRYCANDPEDRIDPTGLIDTSASTWNRLIWMQGGSDLTFGQFDLLRQGQAYLAPPTGNYKDSNVENHVARKGETGGDPGKTRYTISDVEETSDKLIIKPTLNWYVQDKYKNTTVVKSELEHVSRWLWWQSKEGDGAAMVRSFNRNPGGINSLKAKTEGARYEESEWQRLNIHGAAGRHVLSKNPAKAMDPAEIKRLIENVGPVEEPFLGH